MRRKTSVCPRILDPKQQEIITCFPNSPRILEQRPALNGRFGTTQCSIPYPAGQFASSSHANLQTSQLNTSSHASHFPSLNLHQSHQPISSVHPTAYPQASNGYAGGRSGNQSHLNTGFANDVDTWIDNLSLNRLNNTHVPPAAGISSDGCVSRI